MITIKFTRQDSHKKPKLGDKWRRPKGLQSKMRLGKKGYPRSPSQGFGSNKAERGLRSGLIPVIIENPAQLDALGKEHGVVIASGVGEKKRVEIVKTAEKKSLKILSIKDAAVYLKEAEEQFAKRKSDKEKLSKDKESKLAERKKKAEEKEKEDKKEEESAGDKKDKEKKEMDKLLTTKE